MVRDRNPEGRPENARPRDELGRPLPYGTPGVEPVVSRPRTPDEALTEAQDLLDRGRPFQAHEVLEDLWKATEGRERELWQGLAQLCVALTHQRRGNAKGAGALAGRAAARIAGHASAPPHGVDVAGLLQWAERVGTDPVRPAPDLMLRG